MWRKQNAECLYLTFIPQLSAAFIPLTCLSRQARPISWTQILHSTPYLSTTRDTNIHHDVTFRRNNQKYLRDINVISMWAAGVDGECLHTQRTRTTHATTKLLHLPRRPAPSRGRWRGGKTHNNDTHEWQTSHTRTTHTKRTLKIHTNAKHVSRIKWNAPTCAQRGRNETIPFIVLRCKVS